VDAKEQDCEEPIVETGPPVAAQLPLRSEQPSFLGGARLLLRTSHTHSNLIRGTKGVDPRQVVVRVRPGHVEGFRDAVDRELGRRSDLAKLHTREHSPQ
jgi:hypothetical protein